MPNWIDYESKDVDGKTIRRHRYITDGEEPRLDGISKFTALVLGGVNPVTNGKGMLEYSAFVGPKTRTFSQALEAFTWVQNQAKNKITAG